jgi:hypothetical protein
MCAAGRSDRLRAWHFVALLLKCPTPAEDAFIMSYLTNVVATPLWGVCIFGVVCSGRRTAPWLQRARIYHTASKKFIGVLTALAVFGGMMPLFAQEATKPAKTGEGTLMLQGKNYPVGHALAYESKVNDEEVIAVVLSGQPIPAEKLNEARQKERNGDEADFKRPYIKLQFTKEGALKFWSASAGNTSLGRRLGNAKGELKLQDGRVSGKASQPNEKEEMFSSGFDVRFDVALLRARESLPPTVVKNPGPAANVKPSVTGVFKGNGKDAKLAHVSARWGEPFSGKPGIVLVFTEKDHSKNKKPDFDAAFGKFGSALIISLHEDGDIFGCQVVHSAHKKQGFSSIGNIEATDITYADGKVEGELTTHGQVDTFGEKWEVNLKFVAPLGEIPKEFQPAPSKEPEQETTGKQATTEPSEKSASGPAKDKLNVKDLALTKDASDVDYKTLVEQLGFKSKANVKSTCTELSTNLKAQGWTKQGGDLITPASAILKRKRGTAELTIFVKPENGGSEVKMMTEGLAWDEK